jgi:hypothetical protein
MIPERRLYEAQRIFIYRFHRHSYHARLCMYVDRSNISLCSYPDVLACFSHHVLRTVRDHRNVDIAQRAGERGS